MSDNLFDAWKCDGRLDPESVRSRFEVDIGEKYLPLVNACLEWRLENPLHLVRKATLKAALQSENFKAICSIHADLKKHHKEHCVPGFLLELVDGGYAPGFMIAYAFLVRSVPKEYNGLNLSLLGDAPDLMQVLAEINC